MADQKLRELTETTAPVSTDLLYTVVDPGGTPLDRKVEIGTLLGNLGAWINLVKNSPGQIVTDGAEPQWWDDVANATLTDEDAAGEAIADKTERVFKVVTTADDVYGYQTYTFADESLLDAGVTVVSASCWVYCASANKASIGLYGTNMGLTESSQHSGVAGWELLTVENLTLDAADASIQLRLIVDTGTAYFTMPMLNVGSHVLPWLERQQKLVPIVAAILVDLGGGTGDVAWSDLDCTANSHPLATCMYVGILIDANDVGNVNSTVWISHADDLIGADSIAFRVWALNYNGNIESAGLAMCNDEQVIRYKIDEADGDSDLGVYINLRGYWRWAP